jgi:hypothetical protein
MNVRCLTYYLHKDIEPKTGHVHLLARPLLNYVRNADDCVTANRHVLVSQRQQY